MLRHTFAIEKLNAGASLDVSRLLAHHDIKEYCSPLSEVRPEAAETGG